MIGGWLREGWRRDRPALAVAALGSLVATIAWRGVTRPMADTSGYRQVAEVLRAGWPTLTDRTPGFPALLLATGSADRSTHLLFAVQLALHLVTVALVLDIARRTGVGRRGRAALVALLFVPVVLLRVLYEGTECLAALLVTLVGWLLLVPGRPDRRTARSLAIGLTCSAAALVRPTFALLFIPVAVLAVLRWRADGPDAPATTGRRSPWPGRAVGRPLALVAMPALVLVGGYSALNGVRFDSPGLTPLTAYHLSSRTSPYVEELPLSYEPARSVLIRERDRALLRGESSAPGNFIWGARPELERVTGLRGRDLDRYVLEMDLELIVHNPFGYLDTVKTSTLNYAGLDSQPAILGLGRPAAWGQQAIHLVLLGAFLAIVGLVPGLALAGRIDRNTRRVLAVVWVLAGYTWAVSVMTETGTVRLRAPSEPLLALALVVSAAAVHAAVIERTATET